MNGYMGKIVRINLTDHSISYINTSDYEDWGGGHGIGSAIFLTLLFWEKAWILKIWTIIHPMTADFTQTML
jgi:aldehyde:ferredoxin oxidoreductase